MKKSVKIILGMVVITIVTGLIYINRQSNIRREQLANAKQLVIEYKGEEKIYNYIEQSEEYITFNTKMKRKNGDVFDKNYSGIELAYILSSMELLFENELSVVCADNYEIQLTKQELETPGNIYLVTAENNRPLTESDGPFMLVVNADEFSTRWAKNVVKVKVV